MSEARQALWAKLCRLVPVSVRIQERHRQLARTLANALQEEGIYVALAPTVTPGLVLRLAIERGLEDIEARYSERARERVDPTVPRPRHGPAPT